MNIIDAIKSGRRYRQVIKNSRIGFQRGDWIEADDFRTVSRVDILAEYEIEEEKVEITREQLYEAAVKVRGPLSRCDIENFNTLCQELGFKS